MINIRRWWRDTWARFGPTRRLVLVEGDSLPKSVPRRNIVLAREDGEDWCVGMHCPCGCGDVIELLLILEAKPRWDISIDSRDRPSLAPSVWRKTGCKSHFWLRKGRVQWCD